MDQMPTLALTRILVQMDILAVILTTIMATRAIQTEAVTTAITNSNNIQTTLTSRATAPLTHTVNNNSLALIQIALIMAALLLEEIINSHLPLLHQERMAVRRTLRAMISIESKTT